MDHQEEGNPGRDIQPEQVPDIGQYVNGLNLLDYARTIEISRVLPADSTLRFSSTLAAGGFHRTSESFLVFQYRFENGPCFPSEMRAKILPNSILLVSYRGEENGVIKEDNIKINLGENVDYMSVQVYNHEDYIEIRGSFGIEEEQTVQNSQQERYPGAGEGSSGPSDTGAGEGPSGSSNPGAGEESSGPSYADAGEEP